MNKILRTTSDNKDFRMLIRLLDAELNIRYGIAQKEFDAHNNVESIGTVVVAYSNGVPAACGCFKIIDADTAEIKRMFVKSEMRGSGIAKDVILELEKWAVENRIMKLVLETGIKQPEAIRFYSNAGYVSIENYEPYIGNVNSVCMAKELAA